ncbi:B12-binding domain-containing radical SAM protein [Patescibacteria group bacterium]
MKIAFVIYNVLSTERMGIMLMSSLVKQKFPHAEVELFVYTDGRLKEQILSFKPDIVAYSASTGEHVHYLTIAREVKNLGKVLGKKIFQVMGGPHCTFAPETLLGSSLDAVGVGECDDAWVELLESLEIGGNISNIPDIVTRGNFNEIVFPANIQSEGYVRYRVTNIRPRTCRDPENHQTCLDHLPFLDWDLYLSRTNFEQSNSLLKRTIMTRRGCPFQCTYCFNRVFNAIHPGERPVHNYSIERVIQECEWVTANYPTEFWKFYDDIAFFSSSGQEGERLREFSEKWKRRINLPFFVLTRADLVAKDPDILRILKDAGCQSCTMSIEGGNEYVRNNILERSMSDEDVVFAHRLAWDLGIKTFSNVIFSVPVKSTEIEKHNLPRKSINRDIESVKLCLDSRVHFVECPMLFPYPGTKLGEYCKEEGFFDGDAEKLDQSYQTLSPFDVLSEKEKRWSQNLAFLSMWCVFLGSRQNKLVRNFISPLFFRFTTSFLIKIPSVWFSKLYFILYAVLQQYLCGAEIYRPKYRTPLKTMTNGFWGRLRYEFKKQFP